MTPFRRNPPRPRNGGSSRERTLALLACLVAIGLVVWTELSDQDESPTTTGPASTTPPPSATTSAGPEAGDDVPTCAELGARAGGQPVGTCRTSRALLTLGPSGRPLKAGDTTIEVSSASLTLASTASGRRRGRARVSVRISLTNGSGKPLALKRTAIGLTAGARPATAGAADKRPDRLRLDRPIPPGGRRAGTVRFETSGAVTAELRSTARADLGVRLGGDRLAVIRLRLQRARSGA